ncbi:hypothetical protein [Halogeometricum limi]|uniref:hypothetical protein n=1 Tax=Halogeometricum limi TaxID=555875 RepID=UPI000B7CCF76|nr:hypothetical protein [Halogeometricum limi]
MGRSFEFSGDSLSRLLRLSQIAVLLAVLVAVAVTTDGVGRTAVVLLFASLVVATGVGWWRKRTGRDGFTHLGRLDDITYDPFADPGQAAKHRWKRAVCRLPGSDEDDDGD